MLSVMSSFRQRSRW